MVKKQFTIKKAWNIDRGCFDYHIFKNAVFLITCQSKKQANYFLSISSKEN